MSKKYALIINDVRLIFKEELFIYLENNKKKIYWLILYQLLNSPKGQNSHGLAWPNPGAWNFIQVSQWVAGVIPVVLCQAHLQRVGLEAEQLNGTLIWDAGITSSCFICHSIVGPWWDCCKRLWCEDGQESCLQIRVGLLVTCHNGPWSKVTRSCQSQGHTRDRQ